MGEAVGGGRILGVLGGMGPLASAHFMLRLTLLTPAAREQDHVPAILWSDPRVPGRPAALRGGSDPALPAGSDPLPWLLHGLRGLQAAGCGAVAIPCNTAHAWFGAMQAAIPVPILHIVAAAAAELRRQRVPPGRIGLLATQATMDAGLYQDRLGAMGWECLLPDAATMRDRVNPAIEHVKANRVRDAYAPLAEAVRHLSAQGADCVVLGCTEIPLGLQAGPADELGVVLIDTIDALALASIAWATGQA